MFKDPFLKDVFKAVVAILVTMALCRFTGGAMAIVVLLVGIAAAFTRRIGLAAACYFFFPLMQTFNRAIVGVGPLLFLTGRFGAPCIMAALVVSGAAMGGPRRAGVPIGWMWAYLAVACFSSFDGWMPLVSYFKIIYFAVMLIGLQFFAKGIQINERQLRFLRAFFMALALIMIVGSVLSYFVPSIGYSMTIYKMMGYGMTITGEEIMQSEGATYFNGMTNHSQAISPIVMSLAAWTLCDMILIARKTTWLHLCIVSCVPLLAYMSRSRGALLMLVTIMGLVMMIAVPRAKISARLKGRLRMAVTIGVLVIIGVGGYLQVKNDMLSKWLRKTNNVAGDTRTLGEAFTGSRQGLIEVSLDDFRQNPLLGKGFQVSRWMQEIAHARDFNWFTASVEKGVTPYVILAETGICGAVIFLIFLGVFYGTCLRQRYLSTMTCFTVFLVANLADSTLFSSSFLGGFMWTMSCVGAFSTDILAKRIGSHGNGMLMIYGEHG